MMAQTNTTNDVQLTLGETFPEIRDLVRRICKDFPGSYWRKLDENPLIDLKYPLGIQITIELNHEAAYHAPNEPPNSRRISFFLNRIALQ